MAGEGTQDLLWAVKNGDLDVVRQLVETNHVDVNAVLSGGRSAIHYAGDMGQKDVLKYLVEQGADVNKKDVHGITALLAAIWEGHASAVEYLLSVGADATLTAPDGQSYASCAESQAIKDLLAKPPKKVPPPVAPRK
eukprot:m.222211 g.222211  ORF g.222211 m.222211 type:complete len:137 (-) comp15979_c0_seq1:205-615(-)